MTKKLMEIKVYNGYGYSKRVNIYGHVFMHAPNLNPAKRNNFLYNVQQLFQMFSIKVAAYISLVVHYEDEHFLVTTEKDGFFALSFVPDHNLGAGWHNFSVTFPDGSSRQEGQFFVPHKSQFAIISDIDDTIIRSYSARKIKRIYELISKNVQHRRTFKHTSQFYRLLAKSNIEDNIPNPFFYVSSSEWNLYDYLKNIFSINQLPEGIFLLNSIKQIRSFFKSGQTGHNGKLIRIARIINAYPNQKFILIGDNSQKDPEIYASLANRYPGNVRAILIRNVKQYHYRQAKDVLDKLQDPTILKCIFLHTQEAIEYCVEHELIEQGYVRKGSRLLN